jgi:DNA-binding NtrC family response regulator
MPGASGIDLLRRWKAQRPSTPFIIVTAYAEVDSAVSAMKLGAKDYLTKPIKPEELLALVARLVAESAAAADGGVASRACASVSRPAPPASSPAAKEAAATRLEDLEKDAVLRALEREGGNRTHAARLLGISIRTLQRKLKAWGLTAPGDALDDDQRGRPHVPGDLER